MKAYCFPQPIPKNNKKNIYDETKLKAGPKGDKKVGLLNLAIRWNSWDRIGSSRDTNVNKSSEG